MKLKHIYLFIFSIFIVFSSCKKKNKYYNGETYVNYPDLELVWKENMEQFDKGIKTYKLISRKDKQIDTTFTHPDNINWNDWKYPFELGNIHKSQFNKQYKIDFMNDTLTGNMTILYSSLNINNPVKKLSVITSSIDNSIISLYFEYADIGFFSTEIYKVLFINGTSIQVQETIKKPFSKLKKQIRTLYFN